MAIARVTVTDGDPGELVDRYQRVQQRLQSDGGEFPPEFAKQNAPRGDSARESWNTKGPRWLSRTSPSLPYLPG